MTRPGIRAWAAQGVRLLSVSLRERRLTTMISAFERHFNAFTLAFLGVVLALFVLIFATVPYCTYDGPSVKLPFARTAKFLMSSDRDLRIRLTRNGAMLVGAHLLRESELQTELDEIFRRTPDRRIILQADGSLKFASIQHAISSARQAGFREIYLITFRGTALQALSRGRAAN
jgi:biopolymer transport protein ExbD